MRVWFIPKVANFRQIIAGWVGGCLCPCACGEITEEQTVFGAHSMSSIYVCSQDHQALQTCPTSLGALALSGKLWHLITAAVLYRLWALNKCLSFDYYKGFFGTEVQTILRSIGWKEKLQKKPILNFAEINSCLHIIGNFLGPSWPGGKNEPSSWLRPRTNLITCTWLCWVFFNCIYLRCLTWCFSIHTHSEMNIPVKLIHIFISSHS